MVTIEGTAALDDAIPLWNELERFVEKYREQFPNWGMDIDETATDYSQAVRITPTSVRLW